ncbi:MAG: thermonuclease family protein [Acidimicrobiales bacterium]
MTRALLTAWCVLLAIATAGCAWPGSTPRSSNGPGSATVERVVDGDTVVVAIRDRTEHVRLIGVDTPETVKPNTPVECFGPEASQHLKDLLPAGATVRVERDTEARDHFGRLLVYLWSVPDERFVNLDLIAGASPAPCSSPRTSPIGISSAAPPPAPGESGPASGDPVPKRSSTDSVASCQRSPNGWDMEPATVS